MVNPRFMGYETKFGAALITNFKKKEEKMFNLRKRKVKIQKVLKNC